MDAYRYQLLILAADDALRSSDSLDELRRAARRLRNLVPRHPLLEALEEKATRLAAGSVPARAAPSVTALQGQLPATLPRAASVTYQTH